MTSFQGTHSKWNSMVYVTPDLGASQLETQLRSPKETLTEDRKILSGTSVLTQRNHCLARDHLNATGTAHASP